MVNNEKQSRLICRDGLPRANDGKGDPYEIGRRIKKGMEASGAPAKIAKAIKAKWQDNNYRQAVIAGSIGRIFEMAGSFRVHDSERQGGIMNKILPLVLRGGSVDEIITIINTDQEVKATKLQVRRSIGNLRASGQVKRPSKEEVNKHKSEAQLAKKTLPQRERDFKMVGKLHENHFFTVDLSVWDKLRGIYRINDKEMPEDFVDKLRLEFFLKAIEQSRDGNPALLDQYYQIGRDVDEDWFAGSLADEEDFLCEVVGSLAYNLPKPFVEYQSTIQQIIKKIDEESATFQEKRAMLVFITSCLVEGDAGDMAAILGFTLDEFKVLRQESLESLTEKQWKISERILNQLNNSKTDEPSVVFVGSLPYERKRKYQE